MPPPGREPRPPDADRSAPDAEPKAPDDDELFGDWEPRRPVPRLTVVLAAAALVVAGGTAGAGAAGREGFTGFAGATVAVRVPAGTPVTTPGLHGLSKGETVSVDGTRSPDGTVTASSVVSRS